MQSEEWVEVFRGFHVKERQLQEGQADSVATGMCHQTLMSEFHP